MKLIIDIAKDYIDKTNPPCIKSRHFSAKLMADFYEYMQREFNVSNKNKNP